MERRAASHTEEEELNQRRRLLNLARKGDPKAINRLFELYQVRIFSGDSLSKARRTVIFPVHHEKGKRPAARAVTKRKPARRSRSTPRASARKSTRKVVRRHR